jgi:hypothetical protein
MKLKKKKKKKEEEKETARLLKAETNKQINK